MGRPYVGKLPELCCQEVLQCKKHFKNVTAVDPFFKDCFGTQKSEWVFEVIKDDYVHVGLVQLTFLCGLMTRMWIKDKALPICLVCLRVQKFFLEMYSDTWCSSSPPFPFIIGVKHNVMIRICWLESMEKGSWVRVEKIFDRDIVGWWGIVIGILSEIETSSSMARK